MSRGYCVNPTHDLHILRKCCAFASGDMHLIRDANALCSVHLLAHDASISRARYAHHRMLRLHSATFSVDLNRIKLYCSVVTLTIRAISLISLGAVTQVRTGNVGAVCLHVTIVF
jgi:hypothetical protein